MKHMLMKELIFEKTLRVKSRIKKGTEEKKVRQNKISVKKFEAKEY